MNVENLKLLREDLSKLDDSQFDMADFESGCGTVCCVAGWARRWYGQYAIDSPMEFLARFLNVYCNDTLEFLYSCRWTERFNTVADALNRIDYLIENGLPPEDFKEEAFKYYDASTISYDDVS